MSSVVLAIAVAVVTFASGLFGLALQTRLPQTHLSGGSKDMILAVVGLLTLLLALVLGTLVSVTPRRPRGPAPARRSPKG
jgi:hypothetical protein